MDAGKRFVGVVDEPEEDTDENISTEQTWRQNSRAPTENMTLPFSVYLIEEA